MILSVATICLALNIYHEERSLGYDAMAATAVVVMNRADWEEDRVCDVVFAPKQFSWTNRLLGSKTQIERNKWAQRLMPKDLPQWEAAKVIAHQALNNGLSSEVLDRVGDADHYYNPNKASPNWAGSMTYVAKVGYHDFYDSKQKPISQLAAK